jgi:hypothetical protein
MGKSVIVIAVEYLEPEYIATRESIEQEAAKYRATDQTCDVVYISRKGVGSLAEAYNRGFREFGKGYDYVWFVSNITIERVMNSGNGSALEMMVTAMEANRFTGGKVVAIHPVFDSDHEHLRPIASAGLTPCPFVEFTGPMVRAETFNLFPLDERMPYWGHDLDWGHRVRQAGYTMMADHSVILGHSYIRFARKEKRLHPITRQRQANRKRTDAGTELALVKKYGKDWRQILLYRG